MKNNRLQLIKTVASPHGFGVIEIVVVTAIIASVFYGFVQSSIISLKLLQREKENLEATLLASEGLEATRAVRDRSWNSEISWRTLGVPYYPVLLSGRWTLSTTTPGLVDGKYNRYVVFARVFRDASDRIAPAGAIDAETLQITSRATTTAHTIELVTYLTNFPRYVAGSSEAQVISYEDAFTNAELANFPDPANTGGGDPAQSFTTLVSPIKVTKIEIPLRRAIATTSDIYAEIRDSTIGTVLGTSNTVTASTLPASVYTWAEFRFADPVLLAPATKYYIRLRSVPSSTDAGSGTKGPIYWQYRQNSPAPYAGGEAYRFVGKLSNPNDAGQVLNQYDFGFRVYAQQ